MILFLDSSAVLKVYNLLDEWADLSKIFLNDEVAKEAAMLARTKGLKGADAVQLASAAMLPERTQKCKVSETESREGKLSSCFGFITTHHYIYNSYILSL